MDFLLDLIENTELPFLYAFLLGLLTAISPCPMATNITAVGFISKDLQNRKKVFYNGLIYTLGRTISYTLIGLIFYLGADQMNISMFLSTWGERLLGPLLLIIGFFMLDVIKISFPGLGKMTEKMGQKSKSGFWGVLLMGVVFALAFCPYSGVLYFGMLIPMTISSASGLYLPVLFAIATGIPVIIFAWLIAFSLGQVGSVYNKVKVFEKWFRKVIAVIFILVGLYYIWIFYGKLLFAG
jgi:cytochrome c-type biogenesis protein